jgi:hypothetical protein
MWISTFLEISKTRSIWEQIFVSKIIVGMNLLILNHFNQLRFNPNYSLKF